VGRSDWVAAAQWFTDLEHIQLLRQALCSWSRAARRSVEVLNFCNLAPSYLLRAIQALHGRSQWL